MTFTNPSFLWLLPLSLIPVILHLLGRRLRKEVPFSWINLLMSSAQTGKFRRRLVEILVLILRVLVIALPIVAISGPRMKGKLSIDTIAVDVSYSMKPHQREVQNLLQRLERDYPDARVVYFADRLMPEFEFTQLPTDFSVLREFENNLLIITDLQRSGLRTVLKPSRKWYVSPIEPIKENVAMTSAVPKTPFYLEGQPVLIRLSVANYSENSQSRVLVIKGAKEIRQNLKIFPKSSATVERLVVPDKNGGITFDLLPHDRMPEDDRRTIFTKPIKELRVALIGNPKNVILSLLQPIGTKTPFIVDTFSATPPMSKLRDAELLIFINTLPPSFKNFAKYYKAKGIPIIVFDGSGILIREKTRKSLNTQRLKIDGKPVEAFDLTTLKGTNLIVSNEGVPIAKRTGFGMVVGFSPEVSNEFVISDKFVFFMYTNILNLFGMKAQSPYYLTDTEIKLPVTDVNTMVVSETGDYIPVTITQNKHVKFTPQKQGIYYVISKSDTLYRISTWIPPRESDPTAVSSREIKSLMKNIKLVSPEELSAEFRINLIWLILGLAILFLFMEGLLLRFRGG